MPIHRIIPLSYPPSYLRNLPLKTPLKPPFKAIYVGLEPYGLELFNNLQNIQLIWLGKDKLLPLNELLDKISQGDFGISLWKEKGNNYYGDPGKTKLYSACGLPVLMTNNTPYVKIIRETQAGVIINEYTEEAVKKGIKELIFNYDFYKRNVKETWKYINADFIFGNLKLLE